MEVQQIYIWLIFKRMVSTSPNIFVRKSVYKKFGNFDLNYRIASDTELMMRFLEVHKIKASYVPEVWVKMRMGGTSNKSIKNILIQNKEVLYALRSHNLPVNRINFPMLLRGKKYG